MKATGIVRRIDDLGRVVIPKEIRRTMRIREGDPLEIYTDREGEVIFKKYSPIGEMAGFAAQYAETLHKICGLAVVICDRDAVIATSGVGKKDYTDRKMSKELETTIEKRSLYVHRTGIEGLEVIPGSGQIIRCAMPIITEGDMIGCVCSVALEMGDENAIPNDTEIKLIQTAAVFLSRQMEG